MTSSSDITPEDDLLIAEYALGVLPHDERVTLARRLREDATLAGRLRFWEEHMAPLGDGIEAITPPAYLRAALEQRLFPPGPARAGVWNSLLFWRSLTAVSLAALALIVAMSLVLPRLHQTAQGNYVAELSGATQQVRLVAFYDAGNGMLRLNRVAGAPAPGRDFQLWLIAGTNPPVSLGVLPEQNPAEIPLPPEDAAKLAGAVLAISDEPKGGSPTGQPTGAVLATGNPSLI